MKAEKALTRFLAAFLTMMALGRGAAQETAVKQATAPEPAAAVPAPLDPAAAKAPPAVKAGGLIQVWFLADQYAAPARSWSEPLTVPNSMALHRTELKLSGAAAQDVSWTLMVDPARALGASESVSSTAFALSGKDASGVTLTGSTAKITTGTNAEFKRIVQDAYLSYKAFSWLELRAGQWKVPFGREGLLPNGELPFVERSFMFSALKWAAARDLGVMATGDTQIEGQKIVLQAGLFQGEPQNSQFDANYVKDPAVRLTLQSPSGLWLGVSRYEGRLGPSADYAGGPSDFNFRTGVELGYSLASFAFQAEYAAGNVMGTGKQTAYGDLGCLLMPQIELLGRYDWVILNDAVWSSGQQYEATLGLNYYFDPKSRNLTKLQLNLVSSGAASAFDPQGDLQGRMNYQVLF